MIYRKMHPNEYDLLKEFLFEAIYIPEGATPPDRSIIERPELSLYYDAFGKKRQITASLRRMKAG